MCKSSRRQVTCQHGGERVSLGDWPLSIYPSCRSIIGFRLGQAQGAHSESYHLNTVLLPLVAHESPPSITAPYFSSCPSDSTSRWTPCAPENCRLVASGPPWRASGFRFRARLGFVIPSTFSGPRGITPAFGYSAPHSGARGTLTLLSNAAQRTLCPLLTSAARSGWIAPSSVPIPGPTADLPR